MDFIDTFELRFGGLTHDQVAAGNPSPWRDFTPPTGNVAADTAAVAAYVDSSRWVAVCPSPLCGGAELADFGYPVLFCCGCRNADWTHDYLPVELPDPELREEIEAALCARPDPRTRNWQPGVPVADLLAENEEILNGLG